jgi:alpha-L-arabinofuranosidase
VGEWASQEGRPTPDLHAALGDAAWLTGLELNADVAIMEAYAPLLVNVNPGASIWPTNLIGYDALRSYGCPLITCRLCSTGFAGTWCYRRS